MNIPRGPPRLVTLLLASLSVSLVQGHAAAPHSPPYGCEVTAGADGKVLACEDATLEDVCREIRELGEELVDVNVGRCRSSHSGRSGLDHACFQQSVNLKHLRIAISGVENIAPRTFQGLHSLTNVYLYGDRIREVTTETFVGLENVKQLFLDDNDIATLPDGAFVHLKKLLVLGLNGNNLSSVSEGTFRGADGIMDLQLCRNQITSIDHGAFSNLGNLSKLTLTENRLQAIGQEFRDSPLLELRVDQNEIESIDDLAFLMPNLEVLYLSHNRITSGTIEVILLGTLRHITLNDNLMTSLQGDVFAGLVNVTKLDLTNNRISYIEDGVFADLKHLSHLHLGHNNIKQIGDNTFAGLVELSSLYLFSNQLSTISNGAFRELRNLRELSLNFNRVVNITNGSFEGLGNLSTLDLAANRISSITVGTFAGLGALVNLVLSENSLTYIEEGSFDSLRNLEMLQLRNQRAQFTPPKALLSGMTMLQRLDLSGAKIGDAILDGNVSVFFKDQEHSLTDLWLEGAGIRNAHLPLLKNLKRLRNLYLKDNIIGYIISSVKEEHGRLLNGTLPKLENGALDLSSNRLLYIEEGALAMYNLSTMVIKLGGNSFYCDCKIRGFAAWLRRYRSTGVGVDDITCSGPVSMYWTKVADYDVHWWQCSRYVPLIALLAILGFLILLALVAFVISCNLVNIKHSILERRAAVRLEDEADQRASTELTPLIPSGPLGGPYINSLPRGKTEAYILYDMNEADIKSWVDRYVEDKLYWHSMRVTLQWAAGADFIPLWKQVKDCGFGVWHFVFIITKDTLKTHWPDMSANSGVENLSKLVLVLMGMTKSDIPSDLARLRCPCLEWPLTKPKWTSLQREREQFWKRLRLVVKNLSDE